MILEPPSETPATLPLAPFRGALDWPANGRIVSRFGAGAADRVGTAITPNGIEIAVTEAQQVRAVHGGTVAFAAPFVGYGLLVILDHGGNAFTVYGHLAEAFVAPGARVEVLSNIHQVAGCKSGFEERKDLFFVGGYQHPPNIDAAQWFVGSIWPLVRERLPGVNFHLIGSKAPERVRALDGNGVIFHGFVADLQPWLDACRLAVAPLRYGAGVKGKVNMSMAHGQPVVATIPITIAAGPQATDGDDGDDGGFLPRTGSNTASVVTLGGVLVIIGGSAAIVTRKRLATVNNK